MDERGARRSACKAEYSTAEIATSSAAAPRDFRCHSAPRPRPLRWSRWLSPLLVVGDPGISGIFLSRLPGPADTSLFSAPTLDRCEPVVFPGRGRSGSLKKKCTGQLAGACQLRKAVWSGLGARAPWTETGSRHLQSSHPSGKLAVCSRYFKTELCPESEGVQRLTDPPWGSGNGAIR